MRLAFENTGQQVKEMTPGICSTLLPLSSYSRTELRKDIPRYNSESLLFEKGSTTPSVHEYPFDCE